MRKNMYDDQVRSSMQSHARIDQVDDDGDDGGFVFVFVAVVDRIHPEPPGIFPVVRSSAVIAVTLDPGLLAESVLHSNASWERDAVTD
jgi:hypothetical protein